MSEQTPRLYLPRDRRVWLRLNEVEDAELSLLAAAVTMTRANFMRKRIFGGKLLVKDIGLLNAIRHIREEVDSGRDDFQPLIHALEDRCSVG